jgi:hypothetical protein
MIAGGGPFNDAEDGNALFLALLTKDAPPLSTRALDVPPSLSRLVARLLSKAPEDRPATARAVAEELSEIARELGSRVSRPSFPAAEPTATRPGGPFDTLE